MGGGDLRGVGRDDGPLRGRGPVPLDDAEAGADRQRDLCPVQLGRDGGAHPGPGRAERRAQSDQRLVRLVDRNGRDTRIG